MDHHRGDLQPTVPIGNRTLQAHASLQGSPKSSTLSGFSPHSGSPEAAFLCCSLQHGSCCFSSHSSSFLPHLLVMWRSPLAMSTATGGRGRGTVLINRLEQLKGFWGPGHQEALLSRAPVQSGKMHGGTSREHQVKGKTANFGLKDAPPCERVKGHSLHTYLQFKTKWWF